MTQTDGPRAALSAGSAIAAQCPPFTKPHRDLPSLALVHRASQRQEASDRQDLDIAIGNKCSRLLTNVVTAFNSILLLALFERYQHETNQTALATLKKISHAAWQHIYLFGHYTFRGNLNPVDLGTRLAGLELL